MTSRQPGARILIVDDEPEIRSFMTDALGMFGYEVGAAADSDEAFALVAHTRFDLVVSDLRLPGVRGRAFAERLRSIDPALRVIMLTGSTPDDAELRGVREAGIAVLHKPIQLPQLQTVLGQALAGRTP